MSDPWRCVESAFPEHSYNMHVLGPVLNPDHPLVEQIGKRGVHDQFRGGLVLDFGVG